MADATARSRTFSWMIPTTGSCALPPPTQGRGGDDFPEVAVYSHTGERFRFYRDLVQGRIVIVNFFTLLQHPLFPVTGHLLRVAERLGDRLGRDVFMYSITLDPDNDSPLRLRSFALQSDVPDGWLFLSSTTASVEAVTRRLFKTKTMCGFAFGHPANIVHFGNARVGLWSRFVADIDPDLAVRKISWVEERGPSTGPPRRAGPMRSRGTSQRAHTGDLPWL
jgi:protein SCO1